MSPNLCYSSTSPILAKYTQVLQIQTKIAQIIWMVSTKSNKTDKLVLVLHWSMALWFFNRLDQQHFLKKQLFTGNTGTTCFTRPWLTTIEHLPLEWLYSTSFFLLFDTSLPKIYIIHSPQLHHEWTCRGRPGDHIMMVRVFQCLTLCLQWAGCSNDDSTYSKSCDYSFLLGSWVVPVARAIANMYCMPFHRWPTSGSATCFHCFTSNRKAVNHKSRRPFPQENHRKPIKHCLSSMSFMVLPADVPVCHFASSKVWSTVKYNSDCDLGRWVERDSIRRKHG